MQRHETGVATLTDFMPLHHHPGPTEPLEVGTGQRVARILECTQGSVEFFMGCYPRFDYGTIIPHAVANGPHNGFAHGGAEGLSIYCSLPMTVAGDGFQVKGRLTAGQKFHTSVSNKHSFSHKGDEVDAGRLDEEFAQTVAVWREWCEICTYTGPYRDDVLRSALVLKALTYAPSGGLVAAATTSLPETIGGSRNWDYRFTWLRDAAFALYALSIVGYTQEAHAFKQWLEWSTAGRARDLQVMYGLGGERRLTEIELPELEGYRRSRPVRIGNAAYSQFQLDIYGEVMDSAHIYRKFGGEIDPEFWEYLTRVARFVVDHWREPDDGIWETRGGRHHFVFSKVMCWVALDRAVKAAEDLGLPGEVDQWRAVRKEIKAEVLAKGYDAQRGTFVQSYGSNNLDAANLMLPLVGFINAKDPRMRSTIEMVQRELTSPQGYVYRYRDYDDGLGRSQFQLDIYGEVMDSAHIYRKFGGEIDPEFWEYLTRVARFVVDHWREPDDGIWETRGGRHHFVFSKVMCWVALDRAVKAAEDLGLPGEVDQWRAVRKEIKAEVLAKGYDAQRGTFVQSYGSNNLDAANLMLPLVGFINAKDPRMRSTIEMVQRELTSPQGYVYRYRDYDDGLGGTEGAFNICTLWLADNLIALGRVAEARELYELSLGCRNDLGLLSEEIDPDTGEMLGNFPQAFSHMALISTAVQLQKAENNS